jgi:hypothetical protein
MDDLITDEILAAAMSALPGIKVTNAAGYNVSPADTIRAALTAALPLIRARVVGVSELDALDGEVLIAIHDHIHTIMDERAGNKISNARRKKAAAIRKLGSAV